MTDKTRQQWSLALSLTGLLCWAVLFLAGTDLWHDFGRPNFRKPDGSLIVDARAYIYAFYLLFAVLAVQLVLAALARRNRTVAGS